MRMRGEWKRYLQHALSNRTFHSDRKVLRLPCLAQEPLDMCDYRALEMYLMQLRD